MFAFLKTFVWYSILFLNSYNYIPNMTYMYINWFHDFEKKSEYIFIWLALIFNLCLLSYLFSSIRSWKREKKISCCLRNNFYSLYTDILSIQVYHCVPVPVDKEITLCAKEMFHWVLGFLKGNKNFHLLDYIYCRRKK